MRLCYNCRVKGHYARECDKLKKIVSLLVEEERVVAHNPYYNGPNVNEAGKNTSLVGNWNWVNIPSFSGNVEVLGVCTLLTLWCSVIRVLT